MSEDSTARSPAVSQPTSSMQKFPAAPDGFRGGPAGGGRRAGSRASRDFVRAAPVRAFGPRPGVAATLVCRAARPRRIPAWAGPAPGIGPAPFAGGRRARRRAARPASGQLAVSRRRRGLIRRRRRAPRG